MSENTLSKRAKEFCQIGPVVPVVVAEKAEYGAPLAEALLAGGIKLIEITLRTDAALKSIENAAQVEGAIVGAGTVLSSDDLKAAQDAGAQFVVAPGYNTAVLDAAEKADMPILPGAVTPSEIMQLRDRGYKMLKFFPASAFGGVSTLSAYASVFGDMTFCPTGGIIPKTAPDYLALKNVICLGGSWVAPKDAMAKGDWAAIEELARAASQIS